MCDDGEAGQPGGVEARCADDDVDGVVLVGVVEEAGGRDGGDGGGEDGGVGGDQGFEVAWGWGWAATARVEVLGDYFFSEVRVVVEFAAHFVVGVFAGETGFLAAFEDEFEALV